MKLGLDIHGVIDKRPDMFSKLSKVAKERGHEVHVLTGSKITDSIHNELKGYGIQYDNLFSILDHHSEQTETDMWQDSRNNWWIDDDIWNQTKGIYCRNQGIDLHIDDTKIYGKYFDTPFTHFTVDGHIEINSDIVNIDFVSEVLSDLKDIDKQLEIRVLELLWKEL
jgi:hypothetical protein